MDARSCRIAAGLAVAALAAALAQPASAIARNRELHAWCTQHVGWAALPIAIGALLIVAGLALPPPRDGDVAAKPELTPLGLGALFLLEPVLHLAAIALAAALPHAGALDAVLPAPPPAATLPTLALRVAVFAVLAPAAEEFFFRGRLLPWLRARWGAAPAVAVSAFAFAAAHGAIDQSLVALPLGVLLGCLRLSGGGLAACVLVHGVHNGLMLVAGAGAARPPAALALMLSGIALVAFALACRADAPRRRIALRALVAGALVVALAAPLAALRERLVASALPRIAASAELPDKVVARRLDLCRACGAVPALDVAAVAAQRWPTEARRLCVLASCCAPERALGAVDDPDAAYNALAELYEAALPSLAADAFARAIALRRPEEFARLALVWPDALARWLPLPDRDGAARAQLERTASPHDRRLLLDAWERRFPGRVVDLVLALPSRAVSPIDCRHLRLHYDGDARVAGLLAAFAARAADEPAEGDASP